MKDFPQINKNLATNSQKLGQAAPEQMKAFYGFGKTVYADGALSPKVKELIALCLGVAAHCDGCLAHHAAACLKHGATREEVVEALLVAMHMGGGPSMVYATDALLSYDQAVAAKEA